MSTFTQWVKSVIKTGPISPGTWMMREGRIGGNQDDGEDSPCQFRFNAEDATAPVKSVRRNFKAELETAIRERDAYKLLLTHLVRSVESGDEEFRAACIADSYTLLSA